MMQRRRIAAATATWLIVSLVSGCAAYRADASEPAVTLEQHLEHRGHWLRGEGVEVFVAVEPAFRLLSLRRPGQPTLTAQPPLPEVGLRLAYMEPEQNEDSFDPGTQPAQVRQSSEQSIDLELQASGKTQTQYAVRVDVDPDRPALRLQFRLKNLASSPRRYAAWSVIALPSVGQVVVPYAQRDFGRRRMVLPPWSIQPQANLHTGRSALAMDLDHDMSGRAFKLGLGSDAGWIGYRLGTAALLAHVPCDPAGEYPEGDANLTIFQMNADEKDWAEIEHLSPLTDIGPGDELVMRQSVWLLDLPDQSPMSPDALRQAMLDAWPESP